MNRRVFPLLAVLVVIVVFASLAAFVPQGTVSGTSVGAGALSGNLQATDNLCGYTDETTSGPYYISGVPETDNLNYQNLPGESMTIRGVVYDGSTGKPIANAQINVWHVDSTGKYWPAAAGDAANFDKLLNLRDVRTNDKGSTRRTASNRHLRTQAAHSLLHHRVGLHSALHSDLLERRPGC
jgi:protocatechuate 3,4-dioxygenase beta subunit